MKLVEINGYKIGWNNDEDSYIEEGTNKINLRTFYRGHTGD